MSQLEFASNHDSESLKSPHVIDIPRQTVTPLEIVALIATVGFALWLRLWRLDANGTGNPYYAAAVRSMLVSWTNFFFGSYDPTGFVTVDKPPAAMWAQAISAKLLGYSGYSLLLPQALMGVVSVAVLYVMMRRVTGAGASLIAALVFAITPIGVAVDRDNLPDSMLTLVLLLSAFALTLAIEKGRLRWLLVSVAFVGIGFNVKMLAAFVVLPTFYLVYFVAAPLNLLQKISQLTAATVILILVSFSWCIAVELTPKPNRPFIGGSTNNSAFDLALGYNGLGRIFGGMGNMRPPGGGPGPGGMPMMPLSGVAGNSPNRGVPSPDQTEDNSADSKSSPKATSENSSPTTKPESGVPNGPGPGGPMPGGFGPFAGGPPPGGFPGGGFLNGGPGGFRGPPFGRGPGMFGGPPGPFRFAGITLAEQITWLIPLAAFGVFASIFKKGPKWPLAPSDVAMFVWAGWLGTHFIVFSFAQGIFHEYYTIIMGPAVAALVGFGSVSLWRTLSAANWQRSIFPTALLANGAWQAYLIGQVPEFRYGLLPAVLGSVCIATTLVVARTPLSIRYPRLRWGTLGACLGFTSLLVGPAVWSVGTSLSPGMSLMPVADVSAISGSKSDRPRMPPMEMAADTASKLLEFLRANRHDEKYLVAAPGSMEVSALIIQTGEAAISLGGFMGADPVVTKDQFVELVAEGKLRFVMLGGGPGGGGPPSFGPPGAGGGFPGGGGPPGPPLPGGMSFPGGPMGMRPGGPMGTANIETMKWVRENGKLVDSHLWQAESKSDSEDTPFRRLGPMGGPRQLYDLRPETGLVGEANPK